jgi:hypothetical protein
MLMFYCYWHRLPDEMIRRLRAKLHVRGRHDGKNVPDYSAAAGALTYEASMRAIRFSSSAM